jgi:hypothetical protein
MESVSPMDSSNTKTELEETTASQLNNNNNKGYKNNKEYNINKEHKMEVKIEVCLSYRRGR